MLLTAYNLPDYILQKSADKKFYMLSNIFSVYKPCYIENIDENNPRNTLLKYTTNEKSFVFKQPKFLTNGGTLLISNEYHFYKSFPNLQVKSQQFSYDEQYKILVLPYLYSLPGLSEVINRSTDLQNYAQQAAESLALLHLSLDREVIPAVKKFTKGTYSYAISTYGNFISLLQRGYNRPQFLDEVVFPAFANIAPTRAILHHLLNNEHIFESINHLSGQWVDKYLIHGDLKIENLLQEKGQEVLKFIDFENVSAGDNAWDFACFAESVLYQLPLRRGNTIEKHSESLMKRFYFFAVYLNSYCEKMNFNEKEHRHFLRRVLKFWAIRKLEKFRLYDGNFDYFMKSIDVIKKLLLETEFYMNQIYSSGQKRFEIFEF
jgi:thiamine kinase-like enzyme